MSVFTGLSAFPLTPADGDGVVDTDALGVLVDLLAGSGVDSVSVLGSTGIYAYLDRDQRNRAVAAAAEAAAGRVAVVAGVGSLRTSWSRELAVAAERMGADALLLAPMSYTELTSHEVAGHFRAVAAATALPLCIYNNPGTTNFAFSDELIAELSQVTSIAAIKMPPPRGNDAAAEIARLRASTSEGFSIGYSGDWCAASALLAGADAWHSVIAGILPEPALRLTRAAQTRDVAELNCIAGAFAPMWSLFERHGSLRLIYEIADQLGRDLGQPPLPVQRCSPQVRAELERALGRLAQA